MTHYARLEAMRIQTQSRMQRFVSYDGRKLDGLALRIGELEESLGPGWEVEGVIVSDTTFFRRSNIRSSEEEQWDILIQAGQKTPLKRVLIELYCTD